MARTHTFFTTALILALAAGTSAAQTQAQIDRADTIARYLVIGYACTELGFTYPKYAAEYGVEGLMKEFLHAGMEPGLAERTVKDAGVRQLRVLEQDLQRRSEAPSGGVTFKGTLMHYGKLCQAAAREPLLMGHLKEPADFDLERAADAAVAKRMARSPRPQ